MTGDALSAQGERPCLGRRFFLSKPRICRGKIWAIPTFIILPEYYESFSEALEEIRAFYEGCKEKVIADSNGEASGLELSDLTNGDNAVSSSKSAV